MSKKARNRKIYELTLHYLTHKMEVPNTVLVKYLDIKEETKDRQQNTMTINRLYELCLESAQNTSYGGGDIRKVFGNPYSTDKTSPQYKKWKTLGEDLLAGFNPLHVTNEHASYDSVIKHAEEKFGKLSHYSQRFCKTILDAAHFFADFEDPSQFYEVMGKAIEVNPDYGAYIVAGAITGMGAGLSRDYLKGLGWERFVKPDEHILDICQELALIAKRDTSLAVKAVMQIADDSSSEIDKVTPFIVDKMFFLLGSGDFGRDEELKKRYGMNNKEKTARKKRFAAFVLEELSKLQLI